MKTKTYIENGKTYEFIATKGIACLKCVFYDKDITKMDCDGRPCMKHLRDDKLDGYFVDTEKE